MFKKAAGFAIVCPVTNTNRGIPFHVPVSEESFLKDFIIVEQVRSIDCRSRHMKRIEKALDEILAEVLAVPDACIYQDG